MYQRAFTLVELLVTITIIGLLMGIFMPALAKARRLGISISCSSNLKQMVTAAQAYANDNAGYYPIAYKNDPDPLDSKVINKCWDFTYTKDWRSGEEKLSTGLLWQKQTIDKIHQCPAFERNANSKSPYSGYNYNTSYIGHGELEPIQSPTKAMNVRKPSNCIIFGDGEYYSGANKFMRAPFPVPGSFSFTSAGTQGFRHNNKTNIAWCDGHVSSQKELYTETIPNEKRKIEKHNKTAQVKVGFISPDNSCYDLD